MIRINLLPPEILERRKWERYYPYVLSGSGILLVLVLILWGTAVLLGSAKNDTLQRVQSNAADVKSRADKLAVFESKQQEFEARQKLVDAVLVNRIDMGRLAEEISLVLPTEVWLQSLVCDEIEGLELDGYAPDPTGVALAQGYKSAALTLVRLTSLEPIVNVWLLEAGVENYGDFQGDDATLTTSDTDVDTLRFQASADITTTADAVGGGQ